MLEIKMRPLWTPEIKKLEAEKAQNETKLCYHKNQLKALERERKPSLTGKP